MIRVIEPASFAKRCDVCKATEGIMVVAIGTDMHPSVVSARLCPDHRRELADVVQQELSHGHD